MVRTRMFFHYQYHIFLPKTIEYKMSLYLRLLKDIIKEDNTWLVVAAVLSITTLTHLLTVLPSPMHLLPSPLSPLPSHSRGVADAVNDSTYHVVLRKLLKH